MLCLKKEKYPFLINYNKKEIVLKKIKTNRSLISVNNLPNELLSKIFDNLSFKDKTNCEKVCERWQSLVYLNVKDLMIYLTDNDETIIMDNSSYRPKSFKTNDDASNIIKKLGFFLKKLSIEGIDFRKNYSLIEDIQNNCLNIKHFYLKKFKNLNEELIYSLMENIGKNLISFECDNIITESSYYKILDKLNQEKIKKIDCSFENSKVLDLICTNFPKLETLNINFFEDIKLDSLNKLNLISLSITNHQLSFENLKYFIKSNYLFVLKEFSLNCIRIEPKLFKYLNCFKNLESLNVNLTSEEDLETISNSIPNLKHLYISLTLFPHVVELKNLDNFKNLETLHIKCHYLNKLIFSFNIIPTLKNFSVISTDITSLNYDQGIKLLNSFPNLIKLQVDINFVFNFNFYCLLNQMRSLKKLVLFCDKKCDIISIKKVIRHYKSHIIDYVIYDKSNNRNPFNNYMFIKFD